jgi:hypothetical protein
MVLTKLSAQPIKLKVPLILIFSPLYPNIDARTGLQEITKPSPEGNMTWVVGYAENASTSSKQCSTVVNQDRTAYCF